MSRKSRVLEGNVCEITQEYKDSSHKGIDIVGKNYTLDNIVAHSNGTVVQVTKDCNANTNGENGNSLNRSNPSNMVKIDIKQDICIWLMVLLKCLWGKKCLKDKL